ncbi:WAT1-related protein [Panicum miliaceum]|uniref:WAT1-related protein n=1 Tax=Panicum miliaceum TaxID=4540 RepID=A0A3L6T242_PANMI|nr:WAT1-related protein [Panicum miliaceum]
MEAKKPYVIAVVIQLIYTGMFVVSKAAFDHGMNTFVFIFYRMVAASLLLVPIAIALERKNVRSLSLLLLLKLFFYALIGNTFSLNLYNVSMKFTSATVASASSNSMPVIAFCLALLLRMEVVKLRSLPGKAKVAGVALCLAGVFVLAFYAGPALSPVNPHRAFAVAHASSSNVPSRMTWIRGTFLMVLANVTWALWIVLQSALLKEYPNKMLVTVTQCVFSTVQSFVVAVVAEKDFSKWNLRLDISLIAIFYTGFVVTGVSYYLQAWCMEMKGPVFLAMWNPLCFVFTIFCSSFFLGEIVHLGSTVGGALLVGGLYSVLWAKSRETKIDLMIDLDGTQDEGHKKSRDQDGGKKKEESATSLGVVEQA